jgi:hypothetical protein
MKSIYMTTVVLAVTIGCTSSDGTETNTQDAATNNMDHTACLGDEMTFTAGQTAAGVNNNFSIEVINVTPDLTVGAHAFQIRLLDSTGATVDNADFNEDQECTEDSWCTNTWTTIHKHVGGGNAQVENTGDGTYTISGLTVVHAGSWEFRFAPSVGELEDYIVFRHCIEGDGDDHSEHGHDDHGHSDGDDHNDH